MRKLVLAVAAALVCGAISAYATAIPLITSITYDPASMQYALNNLIQTININGVAITPSYTVATLPTCAAALKGQFYQVNDATTPTYNGALTGAGAVVVPVYCNGTAWTSH